VEIKTEETMEVDIQAEKTKIKSLLEKYVTSIENGDMGLYAQNMAHDIDMVNFGAFGDPIVGWDALEKVIEDQNTALSQTEVTVSDLAIHLGEEGKLAWATSIWDFKAMMGENPVELPVRCTWVLEKQEKGWVIVHFHKSVAAK
jgi:uncharacterized protein (TIGR02246 family)